MTYLRPVELNVIVLVACQAGIASRYLGIRRYQLTACSSLQRREASLLGLLSDFWSTLLVLCRLEDSVQGLLGMRRKQEPCRTLITHAAKTNATTTTRSHPKSRPYLQECTSRADGEHSACYCRQLRVLSQHNCNQKCLRRILQQHVSM